MTAQQKDLFIEQGTTWSQGWGVTYNGEPIDDTWTAKSQVRLGRDTSMALIYEFAVEVNEDGEVLMALEPEDSADWTWTKAYYDVEVVSADGVTLRVAEGQINVSREVTA